MNQWIKKKKTFSQCYTSINKFKIVNVITLPPWGETTQTQQIDGDGSCCITHFYTHSLFCNIVQNKQHNHFIWCLSASLCREGEDKRRNTKGSVPVPPHVFLSAGRTISPGRANWISDWEPGWRRRRRRRLWIGRRINFTATMHQLFPVRDTEAVLLSKLIVRRVY